MKTLPTIEQMRQIKEGDNLASLLQLITYAILAIIAISITI